MTKLTLTLTAAFLTMTLAPAAQAYGTDPVADTLITLSNVQFVAEGAQTSDGTCAATITPALAEMLGLPDDWRTGDDADATAVACNGDN